MVYKSPPVVPLLSQMKDDKGDQYYYDEQLKYRST
jgi:hypothetical protein